MNKNLETEYRNLAEQEAAKVDADALWNKIEAVLPEKTAPIENIAVFNTPKTKWYKNKKITSVIGTVAAACVLGLIVFANKSGLFTVKISPAEYTATSTEINRVTNTNTETAQTDAFYEAEVPEGITENAEASATIDSGNEATAELNAEASSKNELAEATGEPGEAKEYGSGTDPETGETYYWTEFTIFETVGDYYLCSVVKDNEIMSEGYEFYLEVDEPLESHENYYYMLVPQFKYEDMYYFKILK